MKHIDHPVSPTVMPATAKDRRPVYFVSCRPEAYETVGEVDRERAQWLAQVIARRAGARFPDLVFCIDEAWRTHDPSMSEVAVYIESHWEAWAAEEAAKAGH